VDAPSTRVDGGAPATPGSALAVSRPLRDDSLIVFREQIYDRAMVGLFIALLVVGIILAILGLAVKAIFWLFWIAVILIIVGVIGWILQYIRSRA
jgi:hypothetical protein